MASRAQARGACVDLAIGRACARQVCSFRGHCTTGVQFAIPYGCARNMDSGCPSCVHHEAGAFSRFLNAAHRTMPERKRTRAREQHHGDAINRLRIARGLTLTQLATRCHVSVRTITRIMHTTATCDVATHAAVAHALDADPLELWPHLASNPHVLVAHRKGEKIDG